MSDYDPNSIARIRDLYSWTTAYRAEVPEGRDDLAKLQENLRFEFDQALAAHENVVRAETLMQFIREMEKRSWSTSPSDVSAAVDATLSVSDWRVDG